MVVTRIYNYAQINKYFYYTTNVTYDIDQPLIFSADLRSSIIRV